ncbi:MAG TPA: RHS repeat-associated core domain-containing protein [Acidobacteriota bacterium]|nr:RHS repeat-associated core domain-containing protein [Acidobacteriota bacterium]
MPFSAAIRAVALDSWAGLVWVCSGQELRAFDFEGRLQALGAVPEGIIQDDAEAQQGDSATVSMAVSSAEGRVWLAVGFSLLRYDSDGRLLDLLTLPERVRAIAADELGSRIWVATRTLVFSYDNAARLEEGFDLGSDAQVQTVAVDPDSGGVWIADKHRLIRLAPSGDVDLEMAMTGLGHVVPDYQGGAWLSLEQGLVRVGPSGAVLLELEQAALALETPLRLLCHPLDHSLWVIGRQGLVHVSPAGEILDRVVLEDSQKEAGIQAAALYVGMPPPSASETQPDSDFDRRPSARDTLTFSLQVSDPGYSARLTSPTPPSGSMSFIWEVEGSKPGPGEEIGYVELSGCWVAGQVVAATATDRHGDDVPVTVHQGGPRINRIQAADLTDERLPVAIRVTFTDYFGGASSGTPLFVKTGGGVDAGLSFDAGGPTCQPPAALVAALEAACLPDGGGVQATLDLEQPEGQTGETIVLRLLDAGGAPVGVPDQTLTIETATTRYGASFDLPARYDGSELSVAIDELASSADLTGSPVLESDPVRCEAEEEPPVLQPSPIDPTVATSLFAATEFLYMGDNPVQTDVALGTIEPVRAAVVRGVIRERDGDPLPGVTVSIKDHPEFGQTLSRADGAYDLAVNGGGLLTVEYQRNGHLPAQRTVYVPWRRYTVVGDVVLVTLDPLVTTVDLSGGATEWQVAQGSEVTDVDGTRRATLLFPPGVSATMALPDGSTQPLTGGDVRLSEYTVGENGPAAMPGELPSASAYTYAVELSFDEAIDAGATEVRFDRPVVLYVDDFLGFGAGAVVPLGFYDRRRAAWVGAPNGVVATVVSVTGGLADLDLDGDGTAEDASAYAAAGITDGERARLGQVQAPGDSLWRVTLDHATPWDCNWPYAPVPDGPPPPYPDQPPAEPRRKRSVDKDCQQTGSSLIACESQTLGETVPLVGTSYRLYYRSDRVPGNRAGVLLDIPLAGAMVPDNLLEIVLEVEVAGRREVTRFAAAPNLVHRFVWDGLDAYGRRVEGAQTAIVTITYHYQLTLARVATLEEQVQGFARFFEEMGAGNQLAVTGRDLTLFTLTRQQRYAVDVALGVWSVPVTQAVGGWTLGVHHTYDPDGGVIYLGDGGRYSADPFGAGALRARSVVYENDTALGAEGPPVEGEIGVAFDLISVPDGTLYVADLLWNRVERIDRDGTVLTVAGTGFLGFSGDGGPATAAQLNGPSGLALAPDGALLIADTGNHRIRRVNPDGTITTIAGNGNAVDSGDGGPATAAGIASPRQLAVAPDGDVFVVGASAVVRRIAPDGIITTAVGTGTPGPFSEGRALAANIRPADVDVAPDGSLIIADAVNRQLYRVTPQGDILSLREEAGGAFPANSPQAARVLDDGSLLLMVEQTLASGERVNQLYRTALDGTRSLLADAVGAVDCDPDGSLALAPLCRPLAASATPTGGIVVADIPPFFARVMHIGPPLPGFTDNEQLIPSRAGDEIYVFDSQGRHLRTVEALTGTTRHAFDYEADGQLVAVTDAYGQITMIARDAEGRPERIVAPAGETTLLEVSPEGYLTRVENPAGEAHSFSYTPDGLLTGHLSPAGATSTYGYDPLGLLVGATNPDGSMITLSREELPGSGHTVTFTDQSGRQTRYTLEVAPDGATTRTTVEPSGATTVVVNRPDGSATITDPDGTVITRESAPHPRFGLLAPYAGRVIITRPDGTVSERIEQRSVDLVDTGSGETIERQETTVTLDGRTSTIVYTPDTGGGGTFTTTSPAGRIERAALDTLGRITEIQTGAGAHPLELVYDSLGRLVERRLGPSTETYFYDGASRRVTSRTDSTGRTVGYRYDAADRVVAVVFPEGQEVGIAYNADGNRTGVIMPSVAEHRLDFDNRGRLVGYLPPGPGTGYTNEYDGAGSRTAVTLPSGRRQDFNLDPEGRLVQLVYDEATVAIGYLGTTGRVGALTRTGGGTTETLDRDWLGDRLVREAASGTSAGVFTYDYNADGQLVGSTLDGAAVTLAYDADGALVQQGPFTYTADGPAGDPTRIAAPVQEIVLGYDLLGRMTGRIHTHNGAEVLAQELAYDDAGRVVSQVERILGTGTTFEYGYDSDGRLVEVTQDGLVVENYSYDVNGNRVARTAGGMTETADYDVQDRLTDLGGVAVAHDADGFRTEHGNERYLYSARGELLSALLSDGRQVTYTYDGFGRRTSRTLDGQTTTYLYGNPDNPFEITASDDPAGVRSRYLYDAGRRLLAVERAGQRYAVASDHLGTPRVVTNPAGTVVRTFSADAWGVPLTMSGTFQLAIGFAGGLADPATGLVRFGTRDYDPRSGRWMSRDPALYDGRQANLYAYAANSPVSLVDPTGAFSIGASAYGGIGGGISFSITSEGFSVCGEVGFGAGAGVEVQPFGDLDPSGRSNNLELSANLGPFEGAFKVSDKCPTGEADIETEIEACFADAVCSDGGELKLKVPLGDEPPLPKPKFGVQAKLTSKVCGGLMF